MIIDSLEGLTVLVTRPQHQAERLANMLAQKGASVVRFPCLEIEKLPTLAEIKADIVLFTSANAVLFGVVGSAELQGRLIAMGPGTQDALLEKGYKSEIPNAPYHSENVLAMDALQDIQNKKVLVVTGAGGRDFLFPQLLERGADVKKVEVYRRVKPNCDVNLLADFWTGDKKIVTSTSVNSLENLIDMVFDVDQEKLFSTPLLVVSQRIVDCDVIKPFKQVILSENASDQTILERLCSWYNPQLKKEIDNGG